MSVLTPTSAASVINWMTGNATATTSTRYIAMYAGDPTAGGVEQTFNLTGATTRTNITSSIPSASSGSVTNNVAIVITASTIIACSVNYFAIMSAATGGIVVAYKPITLINLGVGDSLTIPIGSLTIAIP
jgi:hypothetical protein